MTSYIIGGTPRAGKTTLADRLHLEKGVSIIPHDFIIKAFHETFPQLGIFHCDKAPPESTDHMFPFMKSYLDHWGHNTFVLDTAYLTPAHFAAAGFHEKYKIAFLGYSDLSVEEKLWQIRQYPNPINDWTKDFSDDEMRPMVEDMLGYSKRVEQECAETGIRFFNTGRDFDAVQKAAFDYLTS